MFTSRHSIRSLFSSSDDHYLYFSKLPDVSNLTIKENETADDAAKSVGSEPPTPVVANGSVQSSPSVKKEKK